MKKTVLFIFLVSLSFAGRITIEKFGNTSVAYSDTYRHIIFLASTKNVNSISSLAENNKSISEEDCKVELHSMQATAVQKSDASFILNSQVTSDPILVAIIDTGIDLQNEELKPYLYHNTNEVANGIDDDNNGYVDDKCGYNFIDDNNNVQDGLGHGTLIAGIIAKNSKGNVKILPIRAFDDYGRSSQFLIASSIYYAVQMGAKVINCSFGYDYCTEVMRLAVEYALSNGVIVVASSGNQGQEKVMYPASIPGVVAVSALDDADHLANFSNYGNYLAVSSIGVDVQSTYLSNQYARVSGTSISAGYVSGLIAYVLKTTELSAVENILENKTTDVLDPLANGQYMKGKDKYTGFGKMDEASVSGIQSTSTVNANLVVDSFLNYPNPITDTNGTQFGYELSEDANVSIYVYNLSGKLLWIKTIPSGFTGASAGYNKVAFNCYKNNGEYLPNDTYIALVKAENGSHKSISKTMFTVVR